MKSLVPRALTLIVVAVMPLAGCVSNTPLNTGRLLQDMTDMGRLTTEPASVYKTVQFSSYDRRSCLPGGPGWFDNSDGFGREKIPGFEVVLKEPGQDGIGEYLICDVSGPGAIVRTWTAAMGGTIRLYLDDRADPLYDGPAADFLLSPYRAIATANGQPDMVPPDVFRQFQASYCPIPFAKRCCMTWTGQINKVHFYQVQIRQYEPGTAVRAFEVEDLTTFADALEDARRVLEDPAGQYKFASQETPAEIAATLPPHEQAEVLKLDGPQALEELTLKVDAQDVDLALRQTLLYVICDEHPCAQVEAPIGDFFGAAPGVNPFNSLPLTVAPDGTMTCRYVMPFETSLRIVLDNRGDQPVTVSGSALSAAYEWNERSMHFRARWRVDHDVVGWGKAVRDMPFLIANGSGRYVGTALMLLNPCRVATLGGGWWGEGDEKVFVDGDTVPSTFGTGSEDYFNYAWSSPNIFGYAYCGQPRNDGYGNRGFVANYRWHIVDDLPFASRLAFFLELFPHDRVPDMSYARIGYYYARPGAFDDHIAITDEDLRPLELPPVWYPAADYSLRDAVFHQVEDIAPAGGATSAVEGRLWAGGKLLAWKPAKPGDGLEMKLSVPQDGDYQLYLGVALDPQSGRISANVDGKALEFDNKAQSLDLYVPYRTLARMFRASPVTLAKGEHTLAVVFDSAPDSVQQPRIGLDYVVVKRR